MYFWVAFALQEVKLSIKRLQALVSGPSQQPKEPGSGEAEATSSEPFG
jgi:hypothetical protein